jgi:hypothetical protein
MNTAELIYQEAKNLPEADAREVLDFLEFIKAKRQRGEDETAYLLREPANARDLLEAVRELREGRGYHARDLLPDDQLS